MLILREAFLGASTFEGFMERLPISRAALTSRLGILVDAGLLTRDPPSGRRAHYRLTASGRALEPVYGAIAQWSSTYLFADGEHSQSWESP